MKKIGKIYPLRALDFYVNSIGKDIEIKRELDELGKDVECDLHLDPFLEGITNGEYIYAIFDVIRILTSDKLNKNINQAEKAVFLNLHRNAVDEFKDMNISDWEFSEYDARDCWTLYAFCVRSQKLPLWSFRKEPFKGKPYLTSLKAREWSRIFYFIEKEFFPNRKWLEKGHIKELNDKLLCPSNAQYKEAVKWLSDAYSNTWYNKSKLVRIDNADHSTKKSRPKAPNPVKKHDFFRFMHILKEQMANEYNIIQSRVTEDPGTAGDQVEENWAQFLRKWLPSNYPVVTKGRLIDENGFSSPQVDVLVLAPSYPLSLRDKKHYFAAGVIAAFECKLTLKKEHLSKFFKNSAIIKNMGGDRKGSPYDELNRLPFYGLLAVSHSWKNGDNAIHKLFDMVNDEGLEYFNHPSEMPDVICIADTCTFNLEKDIVIGPFASDELSEEFGHFDKDGGVTTGYLCTRENFPKGIDASGEILGRLIFQVIQFMAFEDGSLRMFVDYLRNIGVWSGIGKIRLWRKTVLSREVGQALIKKGYEQDMWSKWSEHC